MLLVAFASLFFLGCPDEESEIMKFLGKPIYLVGLTLEYRDITCSKPLAVVFLGKLDGEYCWWYGMTKFVISGTMHAANQEIKQIKGKKEIDRAKCILSAGLIYEDGQIFYSNNYSWRNRSCLIDDSGIAALELSRTKFFLFALAGGLLIPVFFFCKNSISRMLAYFKPRDERLRKAVVMVLICSVASVSGLTLLATVRGLRIFASLIYHWIFRCPVSHGTPGFEVYNLLLVYIFYAVVFTIFEPGYFYNKIKDTLVPAFAFGTLAICASSGMIMVLCDLNVMLWLTLSAGAALVLAYYYWIKEGF